MSSTGRYESKKASTGRYEPKKASTCGYEPKKSGNCRYEPKKSGNCRYEPKKSGNCRYEPTRSSWAFGVGHRQHVHERRVPDDDSTDLNPERRRRVSYVNEKKSCERERSSFVTSESVPRVFFTRDSGLSVLDICSGYPEEKEPLHRQRKLGRVENFKGTIDKDYPKRKGGYAFEICDSAVEKMVAGLNLDSSLEFRTVCRKDSQDITQDDRNSVLKVCKECPQSRILITHGTDTLIQTAQFLGSHPLNKIIVLTGAFLPYTFKGSDAEFNVGFAMGCLRSLTTHGVYVTMGAKVFKCEDLTRDDSGQFVRKSMISP